MMPIIEAAKDVVEDTIKALPPGFLALCALNTIFMIALLWFMHDLAVTRMEAVAKMFDTCTRALIR
jgi:hypothetical protein